VKIVNASLYRYDLSLRRSLAGYGAGRSGESSCVRSGLILRVAAEDGVEGVGEIAPLPGASGESIDAAQLFATQWMEWICGKGVSCARPVLDHVLSGMSWRGPGILPPSVQFGVDCAVLDLLARGEGMTVAETLSQAHRSCVAVNALLAGPLDDVGDVAGRLVQKGYSAFKLKVGRGDRESELRAAFRVREAIGPGARLRLDANRAWHFEEAVDIAAGFSEAHIDYIEEPLRDASRLPEFVRATGVTIALDESLSDPRLDWRALAFCAGAFVVKPTLLGGLDALAALDALVAEGSIPLVISSCFESGVGLACLAQRAASLRSADTHAGLGTGAWFGEDAAAFTPMAAGGHIVVEDAAAIRPDFTRMREVARVC